MAQGDYYDPLTGVIRRGGRSEADTPWYTQAGDMIVGKGGDAIETYLTNGDRSKTDFDFLGSMNEAAQNSRGLGAQQQDFITSLQNQVAGRGVPSLADMQLARALGQVQSQAAGSVASQRGLNPALAARLVGQQQAQAGQQAAGQAAMLRAQEMVNAQQMLGSTLSGVRGQEQNAFGMGIGGNQGQNSLNASIDEQNRQAMERAQRDRLGLDQQRSQNTRDTAAGIFKTGAEIAGPKLFDGGVIPRLYVDGGPVAGTAPVPGDHPANDVVPALLSPDEIVLPRTIATAPDAPQQAQAFVAGIQKGAESVAPDKSDEFLQRLRTDYPGSRAATLDAQEGRAPQGLPSTPRAGADLERARIEADQRGRRENYPDSRAAMLDSQEGAGSRDAYIRDLLEAAKSGHLSRQGLDEYFRVVESGELAAFGRREAARQSSTRGVM